MNHPEIILGAFRDELEKISGMARIGKMPVTVANALQGKGKFFKGLKEVPALRPLPQDASARRPSAQPRSPASRSASTASTRRRSSTTTTRPAGPCGRRRKVRACSDGLGRAQDRLPR